ncbi:EAL domain-containing protein [Zhongshania arctica]|uniref:EAL domain-containing protein n=1 Tax=Zhongshania arctica TaxID=3238302 RepID=A0ABV3TWA2_9GAMM
MTPFQSDSLQCELRLFVAGDTNNSLEAIANLRALCEEYLPSRYTIEIVDVMQEPARAIADGVFMTPTLLKLGPRPLRRVVGRLARSSDVLQALGLTLNDRPILSSADAETAKLIATLDEAGRRLEELTGGEVDAVLRRDGKPLLLLSAQAELRHREAARQTAILNALPAHIALIDNQGVIVSFNHAWQKFAELNGLASPGYGVGINYLEACDKAGEGSEAAEGIRSVLAGHSRSFSIEYPCHSPTEQRWFLMTVTPSNHDAKNGAVIMHLNISDRTEAEIGMQRLQRVYAVLSEINELIVRVPNRDELFREACRIAVETGGVCMTMIGIVDQATDTVVPVASVGVEDKLLRDIRSLLSSDEKASTTMIAKAVRDKTAIVSNDLSDDPRALLRDLYTEAGVHSVAVLPLIVSGQVAGVLGLYAGEKDFFHEEEMLLLSKLADDVAFAIDHLERQERLDHLASYDQLTGLANHHLFLERLEQFTRGAADSGHRLALILIDLERFKNINDSLGRAAGDVLLQQVAEWLTQHIDDVHRLARVGVDQFAVVLREEGRVGDVVRQLEAVIEAFLLHPFKLKPSVYRIAAKFGVAMFPEDGADAATLVKNAEAALKKAKVEGHRHLFYTQKMTDTVAQRLNLENQLRQALDKNEFVLHYQPKVNLASGEITGVEALIRWNDPLTGLVLPDSFISILEETGLIYDVGLWALHQALQDFLRWRAAGLNAVRIAVNVSPLQMRHPGFAAAIEQIVAIDPRAAQGLELEITEGMVMADMKQAISSLHAIRALGISIAIDDFGTGYSSLGYLSKLPVDTLKIDRMFIADMVTDPQGLSLVSTIINLAHSLQLKVVAEGVETEEQSRLLRLLKCDQIQGYLFSKPLAVEVLEETFLRRLG